MDLGNQLKYLLRITRSHSIFRRYIVVNGFDGALTMLGLITGFMVSAPVNLGLVVSACLGAAIALTASGLSSAYVSEAAERRRELAALEGAMATDLNQSLHGEAARRVPLLIALANGLAPLVISVLIITPLLLAPAGVPLPLAPLYAAGLIACQIAVVELKAAALKKLDYPARLT